MLVHWVNLAFQKHPTPDCRVALETALATGADYVSFWLALAPTVRALRFNGRGRVCTDRTPESCLKEQLIPTDREVVAI
jgi:hypothetical protein